MEVKHLQEKKHSLSLRIDAFYHKDNSDYLKPNPKVFDKILKKFTVLPSEAVCVGDSLGDALSAKGAKLHFIALLESKLRTKSYFKDVAVDYFALKFKDILDYVMKN